MRRLLIVFCLAGCTTNGALPIDAPDAATPPEQAGFVVHEWGTFTSVVSSEGTALSGLHHEEEALPLFVHGRSPGDPMNNKSIEEPVSGVTQKLETPVVYFYGSARQAKLQVSFPQGIVSQWFPQSSDFSPAIGTLSGVAGGAMTWQVDLVPGMADFPAISPDDIWAPSRRVASLPVRVGDEREQFIFYRGLGAFDVAFHVTAEPDGSLTLENRSADPIAAVFLLRMHEGGGAIIELGSLAANTTLSSIYPPAGGKERDVDAYVAEASTRVAAVLEASGLFADEARAMVDTWSQSYFRSFGTRLLYVVPRRWTDALLPITVEPQPTELVRTLVGRVEVLTRADESELLSQVTDAALLHTATPSEFVTALGRFAEPKMRRTLELVSDDTVRSFCIESVAAAETAP